MATNMSDTPEVVEGVATPVEEEVAAETGEKNNGQAKKGNQNFSKAAEEVRQTATKAINEAVKQVETIGKALGNALQDRSNVVMVRVNNDCLQYLDMMVEADVANSRSEAAAFLINEGIKSNEELFHKIRNISDQISSLKSQLRETIKAS